MAQGHPFAFNKDENVRVGFGMDPDDKLNKANCLPLLQKIQAQNSNYKDQPAQRLLMYLEFSAYPIQKQ